MQFNFNVPLELQHCRFRTISSEANLNNLVRSTIMTWAKNQYADPIAIEAYLYHIIQPSHMKENFTRCHYWVIHVKMIQSINIQIQSMLTFRAAVTFSDVKKTIEKLYPDYRSLVGPITEIPLVKEHIFCNYTLRRDLTPPELQLTEIIELCGEFFNVQIENSRLPNDEVVIKAQSEMPFLYFLRKKYNLLHTNELGIKITNFKALSDAVQIHKIKSYGSEFRSKKLTRLLRADITVAMNNIIEKLKSTKIFPKEKMRDNIEKFATLPFQDAIRKFFQPFLDEEERLFEDHDLNNQMLENDPLKTIKDIFNVLSNEKIFGKLFHLAAVIGTVDEIKCNKEIHFTEDTELPSIESSDNPEEWKSKLFQPLLNNIGTFLQVYLLKISDINSYKNDMDKNMNVVVTEKVQPILESDKKVNPFLKKSANLESKKEAVNLSLQKVNKGYIVENTNLKNLNNMMVQILNQCSKIVEISSNQRHVIFKQKLRCLKSLSLCCKDIIFEYKNKDSLLNKESMARLHLDLLPQAYRLLIILLSSDELEQELLQPVRISKAAIDIIYKSCVKEYFNSNNNEPLTLDKLISIETDILKILELKEWPLEVSYLQYVINGEIPNKQIQEIKNISDGPCCCIAVSPHFLENKIQRLAKAVDINVYTEEVLPTQYGLLVSDNMRKQVEESYINNQKNMHNVMEDGLPVILDIQSSKMASSIRQRSAVNNCDAIMEVISQVPLLEEVCTYIKWNELYRQNWGNLTEYIQDNVLLAAKFNIRIIETQLGKQRVNIAMNDKEVTEAGKGLVTDDLHLFRSHVRTIIGNFVSLVIKPTSPLMSFLENIITDNLSKSLNVDQQFSSFVKEAFSIVPSEFIVDIFTLLIHPIGKTLFLEHVNSKLQKCLLTCESSTIAVLRQYLPNHPSLCSVESESTTKMVSKRLIPCKIESEYKENIIQLSQVSSVESTTDVEFLYEDNRQIVDDIRKSEFGVGLHSDGETNLVIQNCNRRMARLVDHFSSDLYANPTHFVLELIQNADDNQYLDKIRPSLHLSWIKNSQDNQLMLQVMNNECGFTASDLRSLCDIGASTKSTNRLEKIGRKGIGFKSVFLVSDTPEVHSNGFHVRFQRYMLDEHNNKVPNNALVPLWIDENSTAAYPKDCTTIVLPIVSHLQASLAASVSNQLHPSLLLFLRKLKRITIEEDRSIEIVESECSENKKVVVTEDGERHIWFICSKHISITDFQLQQISPRGISKTNISIAIPFNDQQSHDMPTFAFLPIRSYGLRFIINADFTIPASREDINNNCPWNKWLIDQAAEVFIHSINKYLSVHTTLDYHVDIGRFIDSIPLSGEVPCDSPFCILIPKLRTSLNQISWLPDHSGNLYSPSQLIIQSNDDILLTDILCRRLDMSFLNPFITDDADDRRISVLKWLGCQQLSLVHLASLLTSITSEEISNRSLIKSIILSVYNSLQREGSTSATNRVMSLLRSMPLWPILSEDNQIVSIDDSSLTIFLPSNQWIRSPPSIDDYKILRRVISPTFISSFISDTNKHVNPAVFVLKRLGIQDLSTTSMLDSAIAPRLSNQDISRQWLIKVSQFLVEYCSPQQYKETIIPKLSFATITYTTKGIFPTVTRQCDMFKVHIPLSLEPNNNVVSLLHDRTSYTILDDAYLQCNISRNIWIPYFLNSGVSKSFYHLPTDTNMYPELTTLLDLKSSLLNIAILRYLDINWSLLNLTQSSNLIERLTSQEWIPASTSSKDVHCPDDQLLLSKTLFKPSQVVYISTNNPNKTLISDSLLEYFPFCPVMFHNETLPRQLGMTSEVTSDHILSLMKNALVEKSVSLNKEQVQDMYVWINRNLSKTSLRNMFSHLKTLLNNDILLLVPKDEEDVEVVATGQCYWTLPFSNVFIESTQVLEDLKLMLSDTHYHQHQRPLSLLYPELKELFVDIIKVQEFPYIESIADCLHSILCLLTPDRLQDLNTAEVILIADVYNVIHYLNDYHKQSCRYQINEMRLIPCLSGRYRSFNDINNNFRIYSWRNMSNVESFRHVIDHSESPVADFLAINCFTRKENYQHAGKSKLSASQFLTHYFNPPVLEDNICRYVKNREQFTNSAKIKSMFFHLEVIIAEWIRIHISGHMVSQCAHLLASISNFLQGDEKVQVTSSLLGQPGVNFDEEHSVYIGYINETSSFELMVGGMYLESDCIEMFDSVSNALINWLLDGDSMSYQRNQFKKFYKSLLASIETSNRNQVSNFLRSHTLRLNTFSIDYIYDMLDRNNPPSTDVLETVSSRAPSPLTINQNVDSPSAALSSEINRKRKLISIESGISAKQPRIGSEIMEPLSTPGSPAVVIKKLSRPGTPDTSQVKETIFDSPLVSNSTCSRPGTPLESGQNQSLRLDQVNLKNMDAMYRSGRIGEELAYEKLRTSRRLGDYDILKIDWLNETDETRFPYDFKLTAKRVDTGVVEIIYLEVKATTNMSKTHFDLSPQEVTAAWSFTTKYHLLLVFHSGTLCEKKVQYAHIPDVLGQLQDNNCRLLIDLEKMLAD